MRARFFVFSSLASILLVGCGGEPAKKPGGPSTKTVATAEPPASSKTEATKPAATVTAPAATTAAAPPSATAAPTVPASAAPAAGSSLPYCSPEFIGLVHLRSAKMREAPLAKVIAPLFAAPSDGTIEADDSPAWASRDSLRRLGPDVRAVQEVVPLLDEAWLYFDPQPIGDLPVGPLAVARLVDAKSVKEFQDAVAKTAEPFEEGGKKLLRFPPPTPKWGDGKFALHVVDDRTILLGPEPLVRRALQGGKAEGPLAELASRAKLDGQVNVLALPGPFKPLLKKASEQLAGTLTVAPYSAVPPLLPNIASAAASLSFDGPNLLSVQLALDDEASASKAEKAAGEAWNEAKGLLAPVAKLIPEKWGEKAPATLEEVRIQTAVARSGTVVRFDVPQPKSLLEAAKKALAPPDAAQLAKQQEQLRRSRLQTVGLAAMQTFGGLSGIKDHASESGEEPLLSWRLMVTPYLERGDLFRKADMKQAWDGPENKALIEQIPSFFQAAGAPKGYSSHFVFKGPTAAFRAAGDAGPREFKDPPGETLCIVVAKPEKAVPWTKPSDLDFNPEKIAEALEALPEKNVSVILFDGKVVKFEERPTAELLKALVEIADGAKVELPK